MTHHNPAVQEIMDKYTPVQVKRLLHSHDEKDFVHHQSYKDTMQFYADHDMYIHHWLLDDIYAYDFYANLQHAYNQSQNECKDEEQRFELQKYYIKDVVYLFIATVVYDLAASHDLIDKTYKEVEDAQLAMDLEFRKKQLQVIDGGKS